MMWPSFTRPWLVWVAVAGWFCLVVCIYDMATGKYGWAAVQGFCVGIQVMNYGMWSESYRLREGRGDHD